jgi:muramoyltetrapeptide carboxypeptidase LdcA involved in peptidoglycan recycling/rubredoxin
MRMTAHGQAARVSGVSIRYPAPLQPGDRIGVTAPSTGVPGTLQRRVDFCVAHLSERGYDVVVGDCMDGASATSAPAAERAAELMDLLLDPAVRAVVPPWGGELAVDLLPLLDFAAVAGAEPTWLVGYSDLTTLMLPLTLLTGVATLHGSNLMDTPYAAPEPLAHWLDAARLPTGGELRQGAAPAYLVDPWDDYVAHPDVSSWTLRGPGRWQVLGEPRTVLASGRLLGGCLETVSMLTGSAYGDVPGFAAEQAPEGLLLYVEVAEADAFCTGCAWRAGSTPPTRCWWGGRPDRGRHTSPRSTHWRTLSGTWACPSCTTSTSVTCPRSWRWSTVRRPRWS